MLLVTKLTNEITFPDPRGATREGLLAYGGDYSVERMVLAYNHGIFPWYKKNGFVFWFVHDPRMVLFPQKYRTSHGLRRTLKKNLFKVSINSCFEKVIEMCANVQRKDNGTWINEEYARAFVELHKLGYAMSVEVWLGDELVGGLYGFVSKYGFTGESMFHTYTDASKVAFHVLVQYALYVGWMFIDAQVPTDHLRSLGCELIPFDNFYNLITKGHI